MIKSWKKLLALGVLASALATFASSASLAQGRTGQSVLDKGEEVSVYFDFDGFEALKASRTGDKVTIKVYEEIKKFDEKLVNKNETVFATVIKRSKGGMYGGVGKLTLSIDSTRSTGKTTIPLKKILSFKGKRSTVKTVVACVIFPIGWLIKGGDVEFPEGKNTFKAVVTDETIVEYLK